MSIALRAQAAPQQFGAYHETETGEDGVSRQTGRIVVGIGPSFAIIDADEARRLAEYLAPQAVDAPEPIIGSMVPGV